MRVEGRQLFLVFLLENDEIRGWSSSIVFFYFPRRSPLALLNWLWKAMESQSEGNVVFHLATT